MKDVRLVIGNKNYSSWSLCPWLLLKMFNVEFEEISIELYQKNTAEKLGPLSPSLKVPVLLHHEITVWDSLAICEYISSELLGDVGLPTNTRKRASARSVSAEVHSDFAAIKEHWPLNCKSPIRRPANDRILEEVARIEPADGVDVDEALVVDVGDQEADLVHVRGEHDLLGLLLRAGAGLGARLLHRDDRAQRVDRDAVEQALDLALDQFGDAVLAAGHARGQAQFFEEFDVHGEDCTGSG